MKKFIVIGLGNFGITVAKTLESNKCEVLGLDVNKKTVENAKDIISYAIIGDATNKDVLDSLQLKDFDGAIIGLGNEMAPSILVTMYLKEIGLKTIVVRAVSDDHGKILEKVGASEIVFPEIDTALKIGNKLALKNAIDFLPLADDFGILEVTPPDSFLQKSLKELQITSKYRCQILGIKYLHDGKNDQYIIPPGADNIITPNCIMIVLGKIDDIKILQQG